MRELKHSKQQLWYQFHSAHIPVYETDLDDNIIYNPVSGGPLVTGDLTVGYIDPVEFQANMSAARGSSENGSLGISLDHTKSIVTCNMSLPIVEGSSIWEATPINKPEEAGYKVVVVARSPNSVTYAIKKIGKGEGDVTI